MNMKYTNYKLFIFLSVGIMILGISGCTATRLATVQYSDFIRHSERIYIDPAISDQEYETILGLLVVAKNRIKEKFGGMTVEPIVIITGTPENASKYGLKVFPGTAFIAPWEIYIVLNQNKIDTPDVIAHELMHAEVASIIGYRKFMMDLPAWLSEGIAMQVDYREHYLIDYESFNLDEINRVREIESNSDFWTDSKEGDIQNYRAAKAAVHQIFPENDATKLYDSLNLIREGASVEEVFLDDQKSNGVKSIF